MKYALFMTLIFQCLAQQALAQKAGDVVSIERHTYNGFTFETVKQYVLDDSPYSLNNGRLYLSESTTLVEYGQTIKQESDKLMQLWNWSQLKQQDSATRTKFFNEQVSILSEQSSSRPLLIAGVHNMQVNDVLTARALYSGSPAQISASSLAARYLLVQLIQNPADYIKLVDSFKHDFDDSYFHSRIRFSETWQARAKMPMTTAWIQDTLPQFLRTRPKIEHIGELLTQFRSDGNIPRAELFWASLSSDVFANPHDILRLLRFKEWFPGDPISRLIPSTRLLRERFMQMKPNWLQRKEFEQIVGETDRNDNGRLYNRSMRGRQCKGLFN